MNKQIKELAERAGFQLQYNCGPMEGEGEIYYAKEFEKFAELIIEEIFEVMDKTNEDILNNYKYMGDGAQTFVYQLHIDKHFGRK